MGGKVLELESERLRAEGEARGKAIGESIGEARGKAIGESIGKAIGEVRGEERLSVLINKLILDKRNDEIQIVVTDAKKRRQYYDEYGLQNRGVEDHSFDMYIPHCGDSVKECFLRRIPGIIREVIICNRDIDKLWTKC